MVVLHDVAPQFSEIIVTIVEAITDLVGSRFTCAAVPHWHGHFDEVDESAFWSVVNRCDEILLHGWTHQRTHRPGLISKLTNHADEFAGLSLLEIQNRIDRSQQALLQKTGHRPTGLVPPAWRLPVPSAALQHVTHVMRWSCLESLTDEKKTYPLATWSFDWGRIPISKHACHVLARAMQHRRPDAIPCIVIHPIDVQRSQLPYMVELIRRMIDAGHEPTTPARFLERAARHGTVAR